MTPKNFKSIQSTWIGCWHLCKGMWRIKHPLWEYSDANITQFRFMHHILCRWNTCVGWKPLNEHTTTTRRILSQFTWNNSIDVQFHVPDKLEKTTKRWQRNITHFIRKWKIWQFQTLTNNFMKRINLDSLVDVSLGLSHFMHLCLF